MFPLADANSKMKNDVLEVLQFLLILLQLGQYCLVDGYHAHFTGWVIQRTKRHCHPDVSGRRGRSRDLGEETQGPNKFKQVTFSSFH